MSKAEEYIVLASNEIGKLCDTKARKAVEIAREEIYEWLRVNLCNYFDAPRSMFDMCLDHLKQAMKNE